MDTSSAKDKNLVTAWLLVGVIMVFVQILLGGITRLTGSGLSITKWDIVIGSVPPLTSTDWIETFDLYKQTPQYQKINEGMSLQQFKFIFFWEYFHRLWARSMGFVFLLPFVFFVFRRSLSAYTLRRLGVVVLLAATAALFGWIMVASGLIQRPWVNAYKLTVHLGLGISLFVFLFYTWLREKGYGPIMVANHWKKYIHILIVLVVLQICLGGMVSGMKSSLLYPTWPLMNEKWIPDIIWDRAHWNWDSFLMYDQSGFMPTLVQVIHRNMAYLITGFVIVFGYRWIKSQNSQLHWVPYTLFGVIIVQMLLGICTLLGSQGSIPVLYGVLHQGVGILTLTLLVYIKIRANKNYIAF
jgi:cytochrome c oxidase assembly protein subunit 15